MINFHGSTSFGQSFTDSIRDDWGGKPLLDVIAGVDKLLSKYCWLNRERVAALGASYGGYLANWINAHSNRFRCMVSHDGIFNLPHFYYSTDELWCQEVDFRGTAIDFFDSYAKFSPHVYAKYMQTPTLVIHGGKDYRCTETESIALFTALQRQSVPSELLYFPQENHWVQSASNQIVWHRTINNWLARWLRA
eukprot:TRINITY_DN5069_c0_g2_i1.p1 TRINITY_DN5069_c0_g2~~TRINITY_DN5069_c0_g2_i1.p1  ORF type:complete len:193 (-),score=35.88 TRINITY_DN5069_c0_g2_i1:66-644(-)